MYGRNTNRPWFCTCCPVPPPSRLSVYLSLPVVVQVLRGKATEPAGVRKAQGGFDDTFDKGTYVCAGADVRVLLGLDGVDIYRFG